MHPAVLYGIVKKVVMDSSGAYADLTMMPEGYDVTARIAVPFGGPGYGLWLPIDADDTVPVFFTDANEAFVLGNTWSEAEEPPQRVKDQPSDVVIVQKKDKHIWVEVKGSGNVYVTAETGKVKLGGEDGLEPAVLGQTLSTHLDADKTWKDQMQAAFQAHIHPFIPPATVQVTVTPAPSAGAVPDVKAKRVEVK